jgi:hypothetical protein
VIKIEALRGVRCLILSKIFSEIEPVEGRRGGKVQRRWQITGRRGRCPRISRPRQVPMHVPLKPWGLSCCSTAGAHSPLSLPHPWNPLLLLHPWDCCDSNHRSDVGDFSGDYSGSSAVSTPFGSAPNITPSGTGYCVGISGTDLHWAR